MKILKRLLGLILLFVGVIIFMIIGIPLLLIKGDDCVKNIIDKIIEPAIKLLESEILVDDKNNYYSVPPRNVHEIENQSIE